MNLKITFQGFAVTCLFQVWRERPHTSAMRGLLREGGLSALIVPPGLPPFLGWLFRFSYLLSAH